METKRVSCLESQKMEEEREEKIWEMNISQPWLDFILSGEKKKEVRKNSKTWGNVKAGDFIDIFEKGKTEFVRFKVVSVAKYATIEECLIKEKVHLLLPGKNAIEEGLEVYLGFDGPMRREQRKKEFDSDGAICIEVEKV